MVCSKLTIVKTFGEDTSRDRTLDGGLALSQPITEFLTDSLLSLIWIWWKHNSSPIWSRTFKNCAFWNAHNQSSHFQHIVSEIVLRGRCWCYPPPPLPPPRPPRPLPPPRPPRPLPSPPPRQNWVVLRGRWWCYPRANGMWEWYWVTLIRNRNRSYLFGASLYLPSEQNQGQSNGCCSLCLLLVVLAAFRDSPQSVVILSISLS